jgi:hypothetical protein
MKMQVMHGTLLLFVFPRLSCFFPLFLSFLILGSEGVLLAKRIPGSGGANQSWN